MARDTLLQAEGSQQLRAALISAYGEPALAALEPQISRFIAGELGPQLYGARFEATGLHGAFVASHNLILIDATLAETPERLRAVVVEEVGHWLEQQAGLADTAGDEGERLALALLGIGSADNAAKDDHTWLQIGSETLEVELSADNAPSFSSSSGRTLVVRPSVNGAVTTGVAVDPGFLLVDPDAALNQASLDTIHKVTLTVVDQVSNRFVGGDTLAATVSGGISASYDAAKGVLTLSGDATAAQYQQVLRSVLFSTSNTNNDHQRSVTVVVREIGRAHV